MKQQYLLFSFLCVGLLSAEQAVKTDVQPTQAPKSAKKTVAKKVEKKTPPKSVKKELELVNKIAIIIYTDAEPIIITLHDITRKSLDGRVRTEKEVLLDRLMYYEALEFYHLPIPEDMVDKHIASIKEAYGLSEDQIEELFQKEGYSFEEGKDELRMSYVIQQLIQQLIMSRLMVTEEEIQQYHKKNPSKEPAAFRIKKGFVKKGDLTQMQLDALIQDGQHQEDVQWGPAYWLEEDEIADAKRFITKMQPGQMKLLKTDDGHEVIQLIKRKKAHSKTLEERRRDISDALRLPKQIKLLKEFQDELLKKYEIVYYK